MSNLLAARAQMALSLGFHIIFAEIGIAMPAMMVVAEWRWRKTGDHVWLELAKRWAKGTAILFAIGAVSGTVLSFELGLLWPRFMGFAGPIIGIPFSLEGFAFFTEAIFLGIYLYGWDRVAPGMHLFAGLVVAISGMASAVFVVTVNAWMNTPRGVILVDGHIAAVDPIAGMLNPSTLQQALHMVLAAYAATGIAVAGIHAVMLLRGSAFHFHRAALAASLAVGAPAAVVQPLSGDLSARVVAHTQPVKLAAMEGQFETQGGAPARIGGWPDVDARRTRFAIEIPRALSLLAFQDPSATVKGLSDFDRDLWPPVLPVHFGFQIMVALGTAMAVVGVWALFLLARHRDMTAHRRFLLALAIVLPFGFIATEAGWTVTEVGRQPWVVQGVLRTADAVTPMPGVIVPMTLFVILYIALASIVAALVRSMVAETR